MSDKFKAYNVVRNIENSRKFVVGKSMLAVVNENADRYEVVCESPHDDGDFSYLCFSQYCRCSQ